MCIARSQIDHIHFPFLEEHFVRDVHSRHGELLEEHFPFLRRISGGQVDLVSLIRSEALIRYLVASATKLHHYTYAFCTLHMLSAAVFRNDTQHCQ